MKKAAVLLMLMILLCAWMCLPAGASEETGRKRLIVASVIGDEGEKCYYYRAPEESQKQIAGFYYPGAQSICWSMARNGAAFFCVRKGI